MTIAVDPADFGNGIAVDERIEVRRLPGIGVAALGSLGAGAIHAAATGIHAEHPPLARLFVVIAALQLGAGLVALVRPNRLVALAVAAVNALAVGGWLTTRLTGISWIEGLEVREAPQFADTVCAGLGVVAAGAALAAALVGWHMARPARLMFPALAAAALTVPAMISGGTHVHSHGDGTATTDPAHDETAATTGHTHDDSTGASGDGDDSGAAVPVAEHTDHAEGAEHDEATPTSPPEGAATDDTPTATDDGHSHDESTSASEPASEAAPVDSEYRPWPRPFDPAQPLDLADVEGVTPEQQARAGALVQRTLATLPMFSDISSLGALGYASIGDGATGYEHWINRTLIDGDDKFLDPTAPESLVYRVDKATGTKTLVSAMFIAETGTPMDAPHLMDYAGPLITWHAHNNLCWEVNAQGKATIVGLTDANGNCARGIRGGGDNPMVHVWIVPHECGPFSALEGVGAGGAAVPETERTDMCAAVHGEGHGHSESDTASETEAGTGSDEASSVPTKKYDPTQPIDLGGVEGVTPEQQAAAENLVAVNVVRLPQWADYKVAEAAGFHSIGDAITGHEHFIQWDWINDDVWLDPDHPESLVYEPQKDGTKKLVSAMYMLPRTVALEDVPDIGGALMQWHIHDNLCFTKDPVAPRVAGLTDGNGNCPPSLQKFQPAPMIHVWITPHPCGPFAALEGVGAGQIAEGEERLCDHVHGSGF